MTEEHPLRNVAEYHFTWTKHEDTFPELTHCPSCGETADPPWAGDSCYFPAGPVSCEGCDRDLRLPVYAIKDQLCMMCKIPVEESADEVRYLRLETGERLCSNCAADLRSFKYELAAQHFIADWITDDHRQALITALAEVAEAFESSYSFTMNANAKYGRMEPDTDDDLAVKDMINHAHDEIPDEIREATDDGE